MLVLAASYQEGPKPLREIAENEQLSEQYLEQLFRELRKSELVTSHRGARGGYVLSRAPGEISVAQVLTVLEGPLGPMQCVVDGEPHTCRHSNKCPTKVIWKKLKMAMDHVLEGTTLEDLLTEADEE
jgi:Rrf2 family protein